MRVLVVVFVDFGCFMLPGLDTLSDGVDYVVAWLCLHGLCWLFSSVVGPLIYVL